mmetsp:Transcript_30801/g.63796  ORF Transcript_30801/g.63796 Transcript_30801/m.63796 type:complete len:96 (+) Transcript_30801:531-818(+)
MTGCHTAGEGLHRRRPDPRPIRQCISRSSAAAMDIKMRPAVLRGTGAKASLRQLPTLEASTSPQAVHLFPCRFTPERRKAGVLQSSSVVLGVWFK